MEAPHHYRLKLGRSEFAPLVIGGMGVDISTSEMVLEAVRLGCIAHLSDAMIPAVCDKNFGTQFVQNKVDLYHRLQNVSYEEDRVPKYDLHEYRLAQLQYISNTVEKKRGNGGVFVNCMEKVQAGSPQEILEIRLKAVLDAGADGITLSAGLHGHSLRLLSDHPRFRDVQIGIIVSSWRALKIFLRTAAKVNRMPDFVVVEGPLAGGHLGFGEDWANYDLRQIVVEVLQNLKKESLEIPVIPAGGIFDAADALSFLKLGAAAVQVATRFAITRESGLPDQAKQAYFEAEESDVLVSGVSPTGYLFRLLKNSPCLNSNIAPQCVPLGYALNIKGDCQYIDAYKATGLAENGQKLHVTEKVCLCHHIGRYNAWTCGSRVTRLKKTTTKNTDGLYIQPTTEQVINEYLEPGNGALRCDSPEFL